MRNLTLIGGVFAVLAAATPAHSQSALQFSATVGGTTSNVSPGAKLTLTATDIGQVLLATVTVRNTGSSMAAVSGVSVSGTPEMTLASPPAFPVTINPNGNASFSIQYLPVTGDAVTAQVVINLIENGQPATFQFSVTGMSPRLTVSYSIAPAGGVTELNNGDAIFFPGTNVGTSTTAIVNLVNRGTANATVQSLAVTGTAYQLSGASGPLQLAPGKQTSFFVIFSPPPTGGSQGLLALVLPNSTLSYVLTGTEAVATFTVTYTLADGNVHVLTDGSTIAFPVPDGNNATTGATIEVQSQGPGIVGSVVVSGTGFRLASLPLLPATVNTGQPLRFGIVFAPTQPGSYSGTFRINLSGRSISANLTGSTATSSTSLSYIDPDTNNVLALRDGGTLPFPATTVGASSTVTLLISNNSGTAQVESIALNTASPTAFQLINLPALPASATPTQQLRFAVRFSPQQQQAYSAALLVSINGRITTVNLQAQSSGPQFTYSYGAGATRVVPGGTLALGETAVGQTFSVTVFVTNSGNADGPIPSIAATGAGFSVSDLPTLPFTLSPGGSLSFTLNYAPLQPGAVTGRLTFGKDTFILTATGIGARLTYSYTSAAVAVPVADGGVVLFPPIEVGKSSKVQFAIQNTGTSPAAIATINVSATGTTFALEQLPALPFSLDAGATANFAVTITPGATGNLTGALRVNNNNFTLSGSGTQPASLPSYTFQTPSGAAQPAQQPAIGLTLASSYPVAIDGTLKLTFVSTVFTDDPAIQFASGGRTVNFTIPANSTRALFNGNPSMALQTGTTAGAIVITPSFAMRSGFDMTPPAPEALTITIPRAAPQFLSASITAQTTTSFTLVLSGFSTTRSMRQMEVQFTPKQGESFSTTKLTIDLSPAASAWFQSAASQTAGGSFLAAIPFVLQNGSTDDLVHRLQSLNVTATNDAGVSTPVTVPIP